MDYEEIYSLKYAYLSVVTFSKGSALFVSWLFMNLWSRRKGARMQVRWLFLTILFPTVSLIMLVVIFDFFQFDSTSSKSAFCFTIALLLGNVAIMYLIRRMEMNEKETQRMALLNQQTEIQTQSIIALEKSYRAQRTASHEFVHHLNTIDSLIAQQQYDTLSIYVHQLQTNHTTRVFSINSHHPIIDAVLNQKYQYAKEHAIDMHVNVNNLSAISIATDSLVILLSNLIDNALDACIKCSGDRVIHFSFISGETLFLSIENTTLPVVINNGEIESTKQCKDDHGYGLLNVKKILLDLHAEFAFQYQDGFFRFVAEIPHDN